MHQHQSARESGLVGEEDRMMSRFDSRLSSSWLPSFCSYDLNADHSDPAIGSYAIPIVPCESRTVSHPSRHHPSHSSRASASLLSTTRQQSKEIGRRCGSYSDSLSVSRHYDMMVKRTLIPFSLRCTLKSRTMESGLVLAARIDAILVQHRARSVPYRCLNLS